MHLLRYHPRKALDFFIQVFNHSADWYAHPRLHDRLEPPWEVELTFADGTTRKQWANPRLWGLYRGMSVGPYVLQSMLMALESWLLEFAKRNPGQLDAVLVDILRRSDSAALAAGVASVATAYPHASGEALLVLLSVRDYVEMDRSRMVGEQQLPALPGMFPTFRTDHEIYEAEGKRRTRYRTEAMISKLRSPTSNWGHWLRACTASSTGTSPRYRRKKDKKRTTGCGALRFTAWTSASTQFPTRPNRKFPVRSRASLHGAMFGWIPNHPMPTCRRWSIKAPHDSPR